MMLAVACSYFSVILFPVSISLKSEFMLWYFHLYYIKTFLVQEVTYWHASSLFVGRHLIRHGTREHQNVCASLLFLSLIVNTPYTTLYYPPKAN